MKKQLLSILLCLIMVVGLLPTAALAEEAAPAFDLATALAGIEIPDDLVTCICTTTGERKSYGQLPNGFSASKSIENTCLVCAAYVHLQADITTRMSNISALEKEIADLKTDNDTTLKRVNTSINLNEIKEKAIAELGMVYAAPDQIAYYSIEDSDYMTQYEEIPGK